MNKMKSETKIDFKTLESKWRPIWEAEGIYRTGDDPDKPNYYVLDFFPYPSGSGLSVGHGRNYVPTCVDARFHRMRGYNVLHPMGWDAFGLPAENYAIKHGIHPRESTRLFSDTYRRQMKLLECSYDWSREFSSTDPSYYRWTQWFFLLLHQRGLAYRTTGNQWWCPQCQTILANEQVEDGRCWRCDSEVERKALQQWYFRILDYADRLLDDLETIDWPDRIKNAQRNWIGRSKGAQIRFSIVGSATGQPAIEVFTTRPDTIYGATVLVLAPEHPLVDQITTPEQAAEVSRYVAEAVQRSDIDRKTMGENKQGVFTGAYANHPLSSKQIPVWVADYVLMDYGSGAIMAVPAHDERDFAFAQDHGLEIIEVIAPKDGKETTTCFTGYGLLVNSGPYDELTSAEAIRQITADLSAKGLGRADVSYRLRDWLISRQRYWGAPIPIVHCRDCGIVAVPESELPVLLPEMTDFSPSGDGRSPLARATDWLNTTCPACNGPAERETDTMDGFACSSWYFLRFPNPHEDSQPFDHEAIQQWLPVDMYVGGAEHAVMHLLYARFWTKVMFDEGLVDFDEPFASLRNQGMLLSARDGRKMSKSRGNVITPDEVTAEWGVDVLRMHLLFMGPLEAETTWDERGIVGISRFLERYWKLSLDVSTPTDDRWAYDEDFEQRRHQFIQGVTRGMERLRFNTVVASLMTYTNYLIDCRPGTIPATQWPEAIRTLTLLMAPIAPFITEEVWRDVLGEEGSIHSQSWPAFDPELAAEKTMTIVVQVDGKLRDKLTVPAGITDDSLREAALASEAIPRWLEGRRVSKIIIVPGSLVNIVTGS